MQLTFTSDDRLLAVVAHPDDAEILCAGTLARARAAGAAAAIAVVCQGDKGQPDEPIADLAAVRGREMSEAAALVPAELFLCGVPDGEAADTPRQRKLLIEVYRRYRPTLVLAHSPRDYHADHRASGRLAEAASWFATSRGHESESAPLDEPPQLWRMDCINRSAFRPSFYIDISDYADLKRRMLACHKSQLARGGDPNFTPLAQMLDLHMKARGAEAQVDAAEAFQIHHAFRRLRAW